LIRDIKSLIDHPASDCFMIRVNDQIKAVSVDEYTLVSQIFAQGVHFGAAGIPGSDGFVRLTIAHQFDNAEETDGADLADRGVLLTDVGEQAMQDGSHLGAVFDDFLIPHDLNVGNGGGEGDRVGSVGETALVDGVVVGSSNLWAHGDCAEGCIGGSKAFRHGHQVGDNIPMINGKPFASSSETAATSSAIMRIYICRRGHARRAGSLRMNDDPVGTGDASIKIAAIVSGPSN
jgi:hypothetical protein